MSIRTLLIWIIVAGALGAGVIGVRAQKSASLNATPIATSRTIGFDPANTIGLARVGDDEFDRQILERDPMHPDRWVLHWAQDGMDYSWAATTPKARGGIRTLATTRVSISDVDLITEPKGEVIIRQRKGESFRIEFDANSAGGYTAVRVEERGSDGVATGRWFGQIEKTIADAFVETGMLGWRSKRLFDLPHSAISTIELSAGNNSVGFSRTHTGWGINAPITAHGNQEAINDLSKALLSVMADGFVDDDLNTSVTGISTPIATVKMGNEKEMTTLTIGTRADVNGERVYALLESSAGSALVTLDTASLSKLTASVEPYISTTPSSASQMKITGVRINGRDGIERFLALRSAGNWMISQKQADSINRDAIDRLVRVLANEQAQIVRVLESQTLPTALGSIELLDQNNAVLDRFDVAIDSDEAGMRLVLMHRANDGQEEGDEQLSIVWAMNSEEAMGTGAWLTAVAGKRVPRTP